MVACPHFTITCLFVYHTLVGETPDDEIKDVISHIKRTRRVLLRLCHLESVVTVGVTVDKMVTVLYCFVLVLLVPDLCFGKRRDEGSEDHLYFEAKNVS